MKAEKIQNLISQGFTNYQIVNILYVGDLVSAWELKEFQTQASKKHTKSVELTSDQREFYTSC